MQGIPAGLDLDALPGPRRGESPALYFRDQAVASPSGTHFALAYTIYEASMGNEVGHPLWGRLVGDRAEILGILGVGASCWFSPWASWIDDETFAYKAQYYDGDRVHVPIVVIHMYRGFAVVPGSNAVDSRPSDIRSVPDLCDGLSEAALLRIITAT